MDKVRINANKVKINARSPYKSLWHATTYKRSDTSVISLCFLRLSRRAFITTSETLLSPTSRLLALSREDVVPGPTKWSMYLKSMELSDDLAEDGLEST